MGFEHVDYGLTMMRFFSDEDFAAADALAGGLGTLRPEKFPSIKKRQKPAEKVNQSMNENDISNSTFRPIIVHSQVPTANSSISNQKDVLSTSISVETLSMKKDIETAKSVLKELCRSNSVNPTKKQLQKRSSERSQHITSSPYKAVLKKLTANKKKIPSKFPKKKPRKLFYDFHNEEWTCLVCCEPHANSRPRKKWVQCSSCKQWAHEECTPGELFYTCQNCI